MDRHATAHCKRSGAGWRTLLASTLVAASVAAVHAEPFRSAAEAPAAWGAFAMRLKSACEQALEAKDETGRRLQLSLRKLHAATSPDEPPMRVTVSLWIRADGTIERVSLAALSDAQATSDLRALLSRANAGVPPPDMLQPVRLSLSLAPRS